MHQLSARCDSPLRPEADESLPSPQEPLQGCKKAVNTVSKLQNLVGEVGDLTLAERPSGRHPNILPRPDAGGQSWLAARAPPPWTTSLSSPDECDLPLHP